VKPPQCGGRAAPKIAEDGDDLLQSAVRIRTCHSLADSIEPTSIGHIVKDGFEQGSARAELVIDEDTQARWADTLASDPDEMGEGEEAATADVEGLRASSKTISGK